MRALLAVLGRRRPPLVVVVVVVDGPRSGRQVGLVVVVVVRVVLIVVVGVLVADQSGGHADACTGAQTHPGTALAHTHTHQNNVKNMYHNNKYTCNNTCFGVRDSSLSL